MHACRMRRSLAYYIDLLGRSSFVVVVAGWLPGDRWIYPRAYLPSFSQHEYADYKLYMVIKSTRHLSCMEVDTTSITNMYT